MMTLLSLQLVHEILAPVVIGPTFPMTFPAAKTSFAKLSFSV